MNLSGDTKVKEIALSNAGAREVLEKAGVDYCCGGDKPLRDACTQSDVGLEEVMDRLHAVGEPATAQDAGWMLAPLNELTRHIVDHHHRYVREAIRRTQPLLARVKGKHEVRHPELASIDMLFRKTGEEMIAHMQKEEQVLFPYIDALARSITEKRELEPPFFRTVRNPIHTMMKEHDSAGELVRQIRGATSEYTPPADACSSFQALYRELQEFETDLHEHVHLENNILFPRAIELESAPR